MATIKVGGRPEIRHRLSRPRFFSLQEHQPTVGGSFVRRLAPTADAPHLLPGSLQWLMLRRRTDYISAQQRKPLRRQHQHDYSVSTTRNSHTISSLPSLPTLSLHLHQKCHYRDQHKPHRQQNPRPPPLHADHQPRPSHAPMKEESRFDFE